MSLFCFQLNVDLHGLLRLYVFLHFTHLPDSFGNGDACTICTILVEGKLSVKYFSSVPFKATPPKPSSLNASTRGGTSQIECEK